MKSRSLRFGAGLLVRLMRLALAVGLLALLVSVGTASAAPTVSFGQAGHYATNGAFPFTQVVADMNKDGSPDLVVANSGGPSSVSVLLGDGQGGFAAGPAYPTNGSPAFSVAAGDLNGDGNPDVAAANTNSETVSVLLGDGTGALGAATTYSTGTSFDLNPTSVGIADTNADGKSDLVVANSNASTIAVLLNNGVGSFGAATEFPITRPFSPITMRIADFNHDGHPDVVAGDGNFSGLIALLLSNGNGGFASTTVYATGVNNVYTIALGDLNKDGTPDVAIGSGSAAVAVMLGTGSGLGGATSYPLEGGFGSTLTGVTVADFNGDGNPDVLTPGGNADLSLWLGDGTGALGPSTRYSGFGFVCCGSPSGLASGDLNKDGLPDIIGADNNLDPGTGSGTVSVSLNTTPPEDTSPPTINVPSDISVNATSPSGAAVSYSVTASDPDDDVASLDCVPASGSTFAIGTTTVACTASDTNGNTSDASFAVHVKGASEQLADLRVAVTGVGPGTSLADKVIQAQTTLNNHDLAGACSTLNALISQLKALSGKTVPAGVADSLVADATRIRAVLGC